MATAEFYFDRNQQAALLSSPFVASFIGDAREGDMADARFEERKAAWAQWAVKNLVGVEGTRQYSALALPGKFYDPKGTGELRAIPHLEIPGWRLATPDPEFGARLALAGNALLFPWWMYSEVVAAKRVLFGTYGRDNGSIGALIELLVPRRDQLVSGLEMFRDAVRPQWSTVEEKLVVSGGDGLVAEGCGDFSTDEIEKYLPGAGELRLKIKFEEKLAEKSGVWAARRVGVWQIIGQSMGKTFAMGVVTPRLTANSTLHDETFAPEREGLGAVLVRSLVLRRIAEAHLQVSPAVSTFGIGVPVPAQGWSGATPGAGKKATKTAYLRSAAVVMGEKTPEASVAAAVGFIQAYRAPEAAWAALLEWAGSQRTLTVSRENFAMSWQRAEAAVRRAEEPERDDINLILPLAWDDRGRVVRVTFSKAEADWAGQS